VVSVDVAIQRVECSRLSVEGDSQQSSGGVSSSSHAETPMTANGVPVTMFSSNFLLMKADTPNNSSVVDAGRRPVAGEHQPRSGLVTSAVPDEVRACAIQSDGESGVAVVEVDNGLSSEDRRRFWANVGLSSSETMDAEVVGVVGNAQVTKENDVHGVRRQVVDSAYLLAAIEFESEANNRGSGRSSSSCRQRRRKRWGRRPWRRRHGLRMGHRARGQRRQERRPWVQRQRQARRQQ